MAERWAEGKSIEGIPVPESLRLYVFCKSIRFTHLPVPGGLYDQNPQLMDEWDLIMAIENQVKAKRQKKQELEANRNKRRRMR